MTPLLLLPLAACSKSKPEATAQKAPKLEFPVDVAPVELSAQQYSVTASGTITAFESVEVTARVGGAVDKVQFTEGQTVKAGDTLAVIEVARYQLAVQQAKAGVDKAQATLTQAQGELDRRLEANKEHPGLIAGEDIATFQTQVSTGKADVEAAQQAEKEAELNLRDAYVKAPLSGVIQTRTVETGQFLQPGAVLATLLQRDPLLVKFSVTEQDAPHIKPGMLAHLTLRESARTYDAKITLVAGSADPLSHQVPVTGQVDDTQHAYWLRPGAFCDVNVPIGSARQDITVPEMAIRASEKGFLAYVVEGTVAHERVVQLGMHTADGRVEVSRGLSAGELLVLRGAEPLSDGAPVKISSQTTLAQFEAANGITTAVSSSAATPALAPASAAPSPAASRAPADHHRS